MSSTGDNAARRAQVQAVLTAFTDTPLPEAAVKLLDALGYTSEKTADFGSSADSLLGSIEQFKPELGPINRDKIKADRWKSCAFLFQLTNDEIPSLAAGQSSLGADSKLARGQIESFVFLAIELQGENWSRTDLAVITREINKRFPMPAIMLFKHQLPSPAGGRRAGGEGVSLAVIDRRQNLRDSSRDVINSRITVIKDVRLANSHRAHLDILVSLALEAPGERRRPSNFRELYDAWIDGLSTQALNERFYTELAWWYFWAVKQVEFPKGGGEDPTKRNSIAVIRLLTRLIFVWFIKEKGLIPEDLFERETLKGLLKTDPGAKPEDSSYYLAILQNLFFATLNVEMGKERKWAQDGGGMKGDRLIHSLYRYQELFKDVDAALERFMHIPFLNGGLFECLDRDLSERDFQRDPELKALAVKEGNGWVLRVDGFSRRKDAQPSVPNKIFFGGEAQADLNADLGTRGKRVDVHGLVDILSRYKFTVEENTPVEEEVALDPELLGKVFENLLASYNEDTQATARKQSGSFYTPREVVDYMVDEALVAYFERHLPEAAERAANLCQLLSYTDEGNPFSKEETARLIAATESLKILDPACGSGAFPMGVLNKLVHILRKLDPDNALWRTQNREPLEAKLQLALASKDLSRKDTEIEEAEASLAKFDEDFADNRHADYTRKLYLIEKCIHGVDIQPIAVQIAKLRFFISLIVSQELDPAKPNQGITALPNLETKIVAANSLFSIERPAQLGLRDPNIDDREKELAAVNEYYFGARTSRTKRKWRERIFELREELAQLLEEDRFLPEGAVRQLVHWNPFDQNAAADFFDPEWMFQIADGFDITIGNPPYVRADGSAEYLAQRRRLEASRHYQTLWEKWDLYIPFIERGYQLLKPGGVTTMIVSDAYCHAKYAQKSQNWFLKNARILRLDFLSDLKIFDAAVHNVIYFYQRADGVHHTPERRVHHETFGNVTTLPSDEQAKLTHRTFFPEETQHAGFFAPTLQIGSICYVSFGCRPNSDEKRAKGLFVAADLVSEMRDKEHPKRYIEAKDIHRWTYQQSRWLEWGTKRSPSLLARATFEELYEVAEKIVAADVSGAENRAAYDASQAFHSHTLISFVPWHSLDSVRNNSLKKTARYRGEKPPRPDLPKREELEATSRRFAVKYLLGVMNSSTARDFLRANRRSNIHLYPDDWKNLPIPDVSPEQQQSIVDLVEQILTVKRANPNADITALESGLDHAIALLYGTTP